MAILDRRMTWEATAIGRSLPPVNNSYLIKTQLPAAFCDIFSLSPYHRRKIYIVEIKEKKILTSLSKTVAITSTRVAPQSVPSDPQASTSNSGCI